MSGECDKCSEHALKCRCARCEIDKVGCDPHGTKIKRFSVKPVESIPKAKFSIGVDHGIMYQ